MKKIVKKVLGIMVMFIIVILLQRKSFANFEMNKESLQAAFKRVKELETSWENEFEVGEKDIKVIFQEEKEPQKVLEYDSNCFRTRFLIDSNKKIDESQLTEDDALASIAIAYEAVVAVIDPNVYTADAVIYFYDQIGMCLILNDNKENVTRNVKDKINSFVLSIKKINENEAEAELMINSNADFSKIAEGRKETALDLFGSMQNNDDKNTNINDNIYDDVNDNETDNDHKKGNIDASINIVKWYIFIAIGIIVVIVVLLILFYIIK